MHLVVTDAKLPLAQVCFSYPIWGLTVMTVTNKQYKIGSVTSSHYSIHFKRSVWVPIPIQVLERCILTIKMCQKSPKMSSIRFEVGSWKKSRYLINLRGEKENMCREAEKCRVRSRSSSRPTGLFSANQSTGCLWMIDSKGDRLAQRGGRVKLPQTTPGQTSSYSRTHRHTFPGDRLKIHGLLRLRGPLTLCSGSHPSPSIHYPFCSPSISLPGTQRHSHSA